MSYHDLFLSYNRQDEETAKEIAEVLRRFSFEVYFDHLAEAGQDAELRDALRREIDCSRCFALLHGQHGLGKTQKKEAAYAIRRIPHGLDFKNVILGRCDLQAPYNNYRSLEGSPFLLVSKMVEWLGRRLVQKGPHQVTGFGHRHTVTFVRIVQPDPDNIYQLDWRTFEDLLGRLATTLERANIVPDVVFGINEGGLLIAAFLANTLHRKPIGYLKHEGGPPPRRIARDHFALPKISDQAAVVLLVDSELKTGGALRAVVPALRASYPGVDLRIYYAALFAQLNEKYWNDDKLDSLKDPVEYGDLLAAQGLEDLGFHDVFFGGLFGEGRLNPPHGVR